MTSTLKQVLSVSRRTDIPAFYMPWFMDRVHLGSVEVVNPFNHRVRQVPVSPEHVHTMVFWSKNFGPFLKGRCGETLREMGFHLLFNFTINSTAPLLEPGVPDLDRRLTQLQELCRRFGAASVQWRFDPICHFTAHTGPVTSNRGDFEAVAAAAGTCGIETCITSFMDHYRKIDRRTGSDLTFRDPAMTDKVKMVLEMEHTLKESSIRLALCCEPAVLSELPAQTTIGAGACISGHRIMALYGGKVSVRQDDGQRKASGCKCTQSVDVGSYDLHPCRHNCRYCYANPACDQRPCQ
jgi:hypothetical protein